MVRGADRLRRGYLGPHAWASVHRPPGDLAETLSVVVSEGGHIVDGTAVRPVVEPFSTGS
jgi:hypothetical protein